jgi:hypothetical protein
MPLRFPPAPDQAPAIPPGLLRLHRGEAEISASSLTAAIASLAGSRAVAVAEAMWEPEGSSQDSTRTGLGCV